ncbi:diacylglycerol O-acyltransferase 1 [Chytridiales sp. JEL 0842]|nr:diacylglycerol O-acyltransferase 1 [Chytridiales sp. JEL 0842]
MPAGSKSTSGIPGVSYKPVDIYPPADFQYKSEPFVEIPVVSSLIFFLAFCMAGIPCVVITLCIAYPTKVLPVMVAYWWGFWLLRLPMWHYLRQHFEARIVKTSELPATKSYIFCGHPHGLYCLSYWVNIVTNRIKFGEIFPGLTVWSVTQPLNFFTPFWREFILTNRGISAESSSLLSLLKPTAKKEGGKALCLVIGGGREFLHMEAHTMDLVLKKRKGFVKLALQTGCSLVPVLCFGENELYERHDTPFARVMSKFTYLLGKIQFPVVTGRWGTIIPKKTVLTTVFGPPIDVDLVEHPSQEHIDKLHQKYLSHIQALYDEYKDVYHRDRKREMRFV